MQFISTVFRNFADVNLSSAFLALYGLMRKARLVQSVSYQWQKKDKLSRDQAPSEHYFVLISVQCRRISISKGADQLRGHVT